MTATGTQGRTDTRATARGESWVAFAAIMLIMVGAFNMIDGLAALLKDEVFVKTPNGLLIFDLTAWGWINLLFGAAQFLVGVALTRGAFWARMVAVVLVTLNAFGQLAFLSAYPIWSLLIITLDVIVIWALIVHGPDD
jgi:hypothetical protein